MVTFLESESKFDPIGHGAWQAAAEELGVIAQVDTVSAVVRACIGIWQAAAAEHHLLPLPT